MPLVGFEPTIPAFERAKRVHALDCERHCQYLEYTALDDRMVSAEVPR
jgi:hypothetical protein